MIYNNTATPEPVGRVKTVGGYPDETEHTIEWLCKYRDLKDGDLLYTAPQPAEQQPECGCCGQTVKCDDDCDAVVIGGHGAAEQQPISHDWDSQDKCRRCGDRDWYASATCSPKQQPAPDMPGLTEALRQYQHNDGSGMVFGYDRLLVDQYVTQLVEALERIRDMDSMSYHSLESAKIVAHAALSNYRKGGE